jgi:probable F420-dependent oxidoreductase
MIDLGPIGINLDVSPDDRYLDEAAELETLGYSTIWLAGGQLDRLDRVRSVMRATRTVPVATGIIAPDVYAAPAVVALYTEVEDADPGRFVVGLGGRQGPRSLAALDRYLDELDAAQPPVPAARRLLAALGPRKLDIARDRNAGAVTLLVTPESTVEARHRLGHQAVLVVHQMVVLDGDADRARQTARGPLRFLSGVPGYRASFVRMGFAEADIDTLSDGLVDRLVAWGDEDALVARVAQQQAAGADQVSISVIHEGDQPGPAEVGRRLAGRLVPAEV